MRLESRLLPTDKRSLLVTVEECTLSPLLSAPLSEIEQTAIRCADWVSRLSGSDEELVWRYVNSDESSESSEYLTSADFAFSSHDGVVLSLRGFKVLGLGSQSVALILNREQLIFAFPEIGLALEQPITAETIPTWSLRVDGIAGPIIEGRERSFMFSSGLSQSPAEKARALLLQGKISVSPMFALYSLHRAGGNVRLEEGRLKYTGEEGTAEFDAATGRLLKWDDTFNEHRLSLQVERGAVRIFRDAALAKCRIIHSADGQELNDLVGFVEMVLGARPWPNQQLQQRCKAVTHLLQRMLPAFHDFIPGGGNTGEDVRFTMKTSRAEFRGSTAKILQFSLVGINTLREESEVAKLMRHFVDALTVKDAERLKFYYDKLRTDGYGPLVHAAVAVTSRMAYPGVARRVSLQGLDRLDVGLFENDLKVLFESGTPAGQKLAEVARIVRETSADDLRAITQGMLSPDETESIVKLAGDSNVSDLQFARAALRLVWEHGGKEQMQKLLQFLCGRDPDAIARN